MHYSVSWILTIEGIYRVRTAKLIHYIELVVIDKSVYYPPKNIKLEVFLGAWSLELGTYNILLQISTSR